MTRSSLVDGQPASRECATILVTGSMGLVGRAVRRMLDARGYRTRGIDLRAAGKERGDVRDAGAVGDALEGIDGIVHLAAVSRVVWGERDPQRCWNTNVEALSQVINTVACRDSPPWLIFASSREVYGEPSVLTVDEDAELRPMNAYGRSKVAGERLVEEARVKGVRASIVRLSNVYGSATDHVDRVVPAFLTASLSGAVIRVEGSDRAFDFTHVDDAARGITSIATLLARGEPAPPPIQLVTGRATTLGSLASLAIELSGGCSKVEEAPARQFDVSRFCGSHARATALLNWAPTVTLREGLSRLMNEFRTERFAMRGGAA